MSSTGCKCDLAGRASLRRPWRGGGERRPARSRDRNDRVIGDDNQAVRGCVYSGRLNGGFRRGWRDGTLAFREVAVGGIARKVLAASSSSPANHDKGSVRHGQARGIVREPLRPRRGRG